MIRSDFRVDLGDNIGEFFKGNGSVSVLIGVIDHLINLGAAEVLSNAGSNLLELFRSE